jgi:hypothetical protein
MTMNEETVETCHDLAAGDLIAARYKGSLVHRGRVTERSRITACSGSWTN